VSSPTGGPVALVIQKRITDSGSEIYAALLARVAIRLRDWPGFIRQEVMPPTPPTQVDWIEIEHFESEEAARSWLQSGERAILLAGAQEYVVGQEDLYLLSAPSREQARLASVVISHNVAPEDEADFLEWQHTMQAAEALSKGFIRHKIERPIPGVQDRWVTIVTFDNDADLESWLNSTERADVLSKGDKFNRNIDLRRTNYGFDYWFPANETVSSSPHSILKQNLLVLLALYPLVFLWDCFIGNPLLNAHGIPFWLSLFIGNLVSTQLLGWWAVPWISRRFKWWVKSDISTELNIAGYMLLILLYGLLMALNALLLGWGPLIYSS